MRRLLLALVCGACATTHPAELKHDDGSYVTVNGIKTYYEVHGSGPALLMLHGGTASGDTFDHNVPFFAAHYRVIVPERMGHGRTADAPDRPFDYHQMAEDTMAFMQTIGVERADFIGWSDGGIIALDIAVNHPERVSKMAVSGANFRVDGIAPPIIEWIKNTKAEEWPPVMLDVYKRLSPDGPAHWPIVFERMRKMILTQPNYTIEQLKSINAPTLVMAGDSDIIRIEHTIELAHSIPQAQLCIYPGAPHGWVSEKSDAFNRIVFEFLQRSASSTK